MAKTNSYDWHKNATELSQAILSRQTKLTATFQTTGVLQKARRAYNYYYGKFFRGSDGSSLGRAGEQSEIVTLSVNQLRNVILHTLSLLMANRLAFDCQAEATDVEARNACMIGNNLLDQYFYDSRIDVSIQRAVEMGLAMGTSFVSCEWNPTYKLIGQDGDGTPVYSGSPKVRYHSIFDVVLAPYLDDEKLQPWMVLREVWSRWDLIELFPQLEEEIAALPKIMDLQMYDPYYTSEEDMVFVWKGWHRESPALPMGREIWFCEDEVVLKDGPNPYVHPSMNTPNGGMPLFVFRPAVQYASAYGHSVAFDLMPIQEALNILDSSIITNQDNFAIQNIIVPRESSISTSDLPGGNKLVEYSVVPDVPGGGKPEALQLCATPAEVFSYRKELIQNLEIVSGINSVLRGTPQASLISGTALALVATQANSFNTTLESNYVHLAEDVAQFLLYIVSRFQTTEEMVSMVGKSKSNEVRSFKGSDLSPIRKVKVTLGNALARTTAGKVEIAELLSKNGVLKTPEAVIEAIQTGNVTNALDSATAEVSYIKYENEDLLRGAQPPVAATDDHSKHVMEHRTLTFNPMIRRDAKLLQGVLTHMQAHMDQFDLMADGNPTLLNLIMGQPLPLPVPNPSSGVGPGAVPGGQPPGGGGEGTPVAEAMGGKPAGGIGQQLGPQSGEQEALAMQAMNSAAKKMIG